MKKQPSTEAPEAQALAVVTPEGNAAGEMLHQLEQVQIESQEELEQVGEILTEVKRRYKALETKRKEITSPMVAAKKKVDDLFRAPLKALENCEAIIKGKMAGYLRGQEERALAALQSASAAEPENSAALVELPSLPANMSERRTWTFEVEDMAAVPRDFLLVDRQKVSDLIRTLGGENVRIPGIRVFQERQIAVRTGGGDA